MSAPAKANFVCVTYIRTMAEKLWQALIDPQFTRQYWAGTWQDCDWKPGAPWRIMILDGHVADAAGYRRHRAAPASGAHLACAQNRATMRANAG
jgi:uncharacterized protein YndB with AHSA1/START domain